MMRNRLTVNTKKDYLSFQSRVKLHFISKIEGLHFVDFLLSRHFLERIIKKRLTRMMVTISITRLWYDFDSLLKNCLSLMDERTFNIT